jgi:hypothetical protein
MPTWPGSYPCLDIYSCAYPELTLEPQLHRKDTDITE